MTADKRRLIELLVKAMPELTAGQLQWLQRVVYVFAASHNFRLNKTDLFDETTLQNFGDAIRVIIVFHRNRLVRTNLNMYW